MEWNYTEVISALITSPQPLMLFRSIKPIKVQTSSTDKAALPEKKYCWLASEWAEVFLWRTKSGQIEKKHFKLNTIKNFQSNEVHCLPYGALWPAGKADEKSGKMLMDFRYWSDEEKEKKEREGNLMSVQRWTCTTSQLRFRALNCCVVLPFTTSNLNLCDNPPSRYLYYFLNDCYVRVFLFIFKLGLW